MIQYSGGTIINRLFTPATRADWVNAMTQAVSDAGWTNISGTVGSGSDVLMETVAQNSAAKCRFRFFDPGGANACAQTTLKNQAGSITTNPAFTFPGSVPWRVIANKFTFWAFVSGNANYTQMRGIVYGGTLWTPTFLGVQAGDDVGFMQHTSASDTNTGTQGSMRYHLRPYTGNLGQGSSCWIWKANALGSDSGSGNMMNLAVWEGGPNSGTSGDQAYRYQDSSYLMYEPFLSWPTGSSGSNESKLKGQIYDAMIINGTWSGETTVSMDGHLWMSFTNLAVPNEGQQRMNAALFLAIT